MKDIVDRLMADPITDPAHTSQLIVEAVQEIRRLRAEAAKWRDLAQPQEPSRVAYRGGDFS